MAYERNFEGQSPRIRAAEQALNKERKFRDSIQTLLAKKRAEKGVLVDGSAPPSQNPSGFSNVVSQATALSESEKARIRAFEIFAGRAVDGGEKGVEQREPSSPTPEEEGVEEKEENADQLNVLKNAIDAVCDKQHAANLTKKLYEAVKSNDVQRVVNALAAFPDKKDASDDCKKIAKVLMQHGSDMMQGKSGRDRQAILHFLLGAAYEKKVKATSFGDLSETVHTAIFSSSGEVRGGHESFGGVKEDTKKELNSAVAFLKKVRESAMAFLLRETATHPSEAQNGLENDVNYHLTSYLDAVFPLKNEAEAGAAEEASEEATKATLMRSVLLLEAAKAGEGKGNAHHFGSLVERYRTGAVSKQDAEGMVRRMPDKKQRKAKLKVFESARGDKARKLVDTLFQPIEIELNTVLCDENTKGYFVMLEDADPKKQLSSEELLRAYRKEHLERIKILKETLTQEVQKCMGKSEKSTTQLMQIAGFIAAFGDMVRICGSPDARAQEKSDAYKAAVVAADRIPGLAQNRRINILIGVALISLTLTLVTGLVLFEPHIVSHITAHTNLLKDVYDNAGKYFSVAASTIGGFGAVLAIGLIKSDFFQHKPRAITTDFFKAQKSLEKEEGGLREQARGMIDEFVLARAAGA